MCNLKAAKIRADAEVTTKYMNTMQSVHERYMNTMQSVHERYMSTRAKSTSDSLSSSSSSSSESSQGTTPSSANMPPVGTVSFHNPDQSIADLGEGERNVVLCLLLNKFIVSFIIYVE